MKLNKRGISLIVLVITIIVMIVLAAAIILSLSSSGVIGRSGQAQKQSDYANAKQVVALAQGNWLLDRQSEGILSNDYDNSFSEYAESELKKAGYDISDEKADDKLKTGSYEVAEDGKIYVYPKIPEGFVASKIDSEDEVSEGLVIYKGTAEVTDEDVDSNGIIDVQETRDQFVWIPVNNISEFVRKDGYSNGALQTFVSRKLITEPFSKGTINEINDVTGEYKEYAKMVASVEKYGGFYIARYEAGKVAIDTVDTVVSRRKMPVWNNIPWGADVADIGTSGAVILARSMYPESPNKQIVSTLCYGVQWDAIVNFVKDVPNPNLSGNKMYIEDSTGMGYYQYNSSWGSINPGKLQVTGSSDLYKVKNIYDMAGNASEWTMEALR